MKLYRDFTGHEPTKVSAIKISVPDTGLQVGNCIGIIYETVRDGVKENYIHQFRKTSRPRFVVSSDGKTLLLLGGAFQFTEAGIEDR